MDGNQNNQNNKQSNSNQNSNQPKTGLSWTQPAANNATANQNKPKTATATAPTDSTGRIIGIIVGIIVVFALAAWGIVALNKRSETNAISNATSTAATTSANGVTGTATPTPVATPTPTPTPAPAATPTPVSLASTGSATFTVATQDAGNQVLVEGLTLSDPTWILVYESRDGNPGNILGAGLFFKGDTTATVHLLRSTTPGHTYFASAAVDNGDKLFAKADEKFVPDNSGAQMWIKFQTR